MSAESKLSWYHCGHCDQMFQSGLGDNPSRVCSHCGKRSGSGLVVPANSPQATIVGPTQVVPSQPKARTKRNWGIVKIVMAWLALMVVALLIHRYFRALGIEEKRAEMEALRMEKSDALERERALLRESLVDCHLALAGLISAESADKQEYIWHAEENFDDVGEIYRNGKYRLLDVNKIERVSQDTFEIDGEKMIETRWIQQDLGEFDAIFRQDKKGKWKVDWKHFSGAGDFSWETLVNEEGKIDGQMRLMAKVLESEEDDEDVMRVAVFPWKFLVPVEVPEEPIIFSLDPSSDEALLLNAAVDHRMRKRRPFGRTVLDSVPTNIVRFRGRIHRQRVGEIVNFELKQVAACHWIDTDAVGYDLSQLRDDLFSGK